MTAHHPSSPHLAQRTHESGRSDQSCYLPELDKFDPDRAMRGGQHRATPDIEAISGPVRSAARIESGRWRPARIGRALRTMIADATKLRQSQGGKRI